MGHYVHAEVSARMDACVVRKPNTLNQEKQGEMLIAGTVHRSLLSHTAGFSVNHGHC